jgi:DNA repair exonuclease SbcCD ATPase subunit
MNEEEKKAIEILDTFELRRKTKNYKEISLEDSQSVKILLNLIEKLQKENEEYSKQLDLDYVDKNYISKKKIEDTIEELKGKLEDISKRREKSKTKEEETVLWCLEIRTDERIKTLQELL